MTWLTTWPQGTDKLAASDVAMVDVGEGSTPGSDWWVVAEKSDDTGRTYYLSWLTTSPSVDDQTNAKWISIFMGSAGNNADWQLVNWQGDQLDKGKAAQRLAVSCLGGTINN